MTETLDAPTSAIDRGVVPSTPPETWPRYQHLPDLGERDYASLRDSIAAHGVLVPVVVDEGGRIIDGHNRVMICAELGRTEYPRVTVSGLDEEQKRYWAYALNVARRHLTIPEKRIAIAEWLRKHPEDSDRRIGAAMQVDGKTVGVVRQRMEDAAEIPQIIRPHQRTDQGRSVPAAAEEPEVDPRCTVEVLLGFARGGVRMEWRSGRLWLDEAAPKTRAEEHALCVNIVKQLLAAMRDRPLPTMR